MRRRDVLQLLALTAAPGCCCACAARAPAHLVSMAPPGVPASRAAARSRLIELGARYEALMRQHGQAEWARYAGKLAEGPAVQAAMQRLRGEESRAFEAAGKVLDYFGHGVVSPRQVELWRRGALGLELLGDPRSTELGDRLEAIINDHVFVLDGKTLTRADLQRMQRSPDPAIRRATRTLEHSLHVRAAPVARELLQRRRDLAKQKKRRDFYTELLALRGVDVRELERLTRELLVKTRAPHARMVGRLGRVLGRRLAPWDVDYALRRIVDVPDERFPADKALPFALSLYRAFGIDLEHPRLDVTVRDFAFGGQTISVHVPDDVRLVVNPSPGARFYTTLVHELGHAFAATRTSATNPLYKGYEWVPGLSDAALAEGIAETFARLFDVPEVLREHAGLDAPTAGHLVVQRRLQTLLSIRRGLASIAFERAALARPDADLRPALADDRAQRRRDTHSTRDGTDLGDLAVPVDVPRVHAELRARGHVRRAGPRRVARAFPCGLDLAACRCVLDRARGRRRRALDAPREARPDNRRSAVSGTAASILDRRLTGFVASSGSRD